ncbi:MAG TPA: single-stranded-DNA-specific exonuclease RecJ [Bacillota bacterium]|nr:single-stranded-DNA-specific exonuclease RecJ [Bacillota bacterium]
MLQSKMKWNFLDEPTIPQSMNDGMHISPMIMRLLAQRGVTEPADIKKFLSPDLADLNSPANLATIEKAKERVYDAIEHHEKILIFGDYDADGICSTAVLLHTLKELGADCDYYIPNRFSEGYGPNESAFRKAYEAGFTLIITVDTGIGAVDEVMWANQHGLDVIITDHHEVQETLPDAFAIVHPKSSPAYPFQELAGVGVAFKFAEYLLGYFPHHLLDLVAIGTIADLVPLVGENRILTYHGLKTLTKTERPGLKALKRVCRIDGHTTEKDVGFLIAPRINAVGRLQDADLAVDLLMTEDENKAEQMAEMIQALNEKRQRLVKQIVKEAEQMVDKDRGVIVVAKKGWNEGVLGIVASQLVREYDRPAIVLTIKEDLQEAKGSARSIPSFNIFESGMRIRHLFNRFGGHSQAAGMTLPLDNIEKVRDELDLMIMEELTPDELRQEIDICQTVSVTDLDEKLADDIERLAPFGIKNPRPIFHLKDIPSETRQIGSQNKHLKLKFKKDQTVLEAIGFGMGHLYPFITKQTNVSIVGELNINEWNGNRIVQIVMHDLKIDEWQLFDHRGKKVVDFTNFIHENERGLILGNEPINPLPVRTTFVSYAMEPSSMPKSDTLFVIDLPPDLSVFKKIMHHVRPMNVHMCFRVTDGAYMKPFPDRDDFKWFYALLFKRRTLDLHKELKKIMTVKSWSKERVLFMAKVFFELEFVKINNGIIQINPRPSKKDLRESKLYQQRLQQAEIEKTLYYSTYNELKNYLLNCVGHTPALKEEVSHGL